MSATEPSDLEARLIVAARHPYKGPNDTDASMLRAAAKRLDAGYEAGGSNTRQMVARVCREVAALLDEPENVLPAAPVSVAPWDQGFGDLTAPGCSRCSCRDICTCGCVLHPTAPVPASRGEVGLARLIWDTSRADESTISAIGADHVARAILAAGFLSPEDVAERVATAKAEVLRSEGLHRLFDRLMQCTEHRDAMRYGDEGTAYSNGAKRMAAAVRAEFQAKFADLRAALGDGR